MAFRNGNNLYICDDQCELCEGKAYIVVGQYSEFIVRRMELVDRDIKIPCPNADQSDEVI